MKLLYTGPVLDFSGFAHASRSLLRALNESSELDIVVRPLTYDQLDEGQSFQTPEWMQTLLEKDLLDVDIALQMTTSNIEAVPVPGIVNGLYTFFETDRLQPSWAAAAQQFDFIIVPSRHNAETLLRSGVQRPVLVAPPSCDLDVYEKDYELFNIPGAEDKTVFYNICQISTKKGIDTLLRAYYAAFAGTPNEVLLVLKTYVNMQGRTNDLEIVKQYVKSVRDKCRIPINDFPAVVPVVYTMSDDEINGLHKRGDAYVCSSRAEGWGLPVFDALAHGNTVISHQGGGLADFVSAENSLLYGGMATFFYDIPHQDPGLFTGLEQCFEPSPAELAFMMRKYHLLRKGAGTDELNEENKVEWESVLNRRANAKLLGQKMDYRTVSPKIVEQLLAVFNSYKETGTANFVKPEESLEDTLA